MNKMKILLKLKILKKQDFGNKLYYNGSKK